MNDTTAAMGPGAAKAGERLLTIRSGGWVLLLAFVIGIFITLYVVVPAMVKISNRPPGDLESPATYGFVLDGPGFDADALVTAQLHRDMAAPIVDPERVDHEWVTTWNEENRGKYLVDSDVVIGVSIGGEARAYPLSWMTFHEVANDVVGGTPVLVVVNPLSRAMAVYARTVGDRVAEFGTAGLLLENTMLLYERRRGDDGALLVGEETLWHPVTGAALTGAPSEAEAVLERLPLVVTQYGDWRMRHPETTVAARDERLYKQYAETNYDRYWLTSKLEYPLSQDPPADLEPKDFCLVVPDGAGPGRDLIVPSDRIEAFATRAIDPETGEAVARPRWKGRPDQTEEDPPRRWILETPLGPIAAEKREDPEAYTLRGVDGSPLPHVQAFWFAWSQTGRPFVIVEDAEGVPAAPSAGAGATVPAAGSEA